MVEAAEMKRPKWLSEDEFLPIATGKGAGKKIVNFRLSAEARRILEVEVERLGEDADKTKAIELLLREIREHRKSAKK